MTRRCFRFVVGLLGTGWLGGTVYGGWWLVVLLPYNPSLSTRRLVPFSFPIAIDGCRAHVTVKGRRGDIKIHSFHSFFFVYSCYYYVTNPTILPSPQPNPTATHNEHETQRHSPLSVLTSHTMGTIRFIAATTLILFTAVVMLSLQCVFGLLYFVSNRLGLFWCSSL